MPAGGQEAVAGKGKRKMQSTTHSVEGEAPEGPEVRSPATKRARESAGGPGEPAHPPPDRASVEPGQDDTPDKAKVQEADSGVQDGAGLGLADLLQEGSAHVLDEAAALLGPGGDSELPLPMALDRASPSHVAQEALAAAAGGASIIVDAEMSLGAPAEAQATDLLPPTAAAATVAAAAPLPASGDRQESTLVPQCAVVIGTPLEPAEVSTSHLHPLPQHEPSPHYLAVRADLAAAVIPPEAAGVSWDHFPNHLGEGVRSRLLSLATLHLRAPPGSCPAAVRQLQANSNRVLLGGALSCELYQERVIRALAGKVGVPLLVADAYNLRLDDEDLKDDGGPSSVEDLYGGTSFLPDPFDLSDEDDPFLRLPKSDADKDGKDSLDTAVALRRAKPTTRNPGPSGLFSVSVLPPGRQPSELAAAAAAAADAAARASAVAKNLQDRAAKQLASKTASGAPGQPKPGGAQQAATQAQQPAQAQQAVPAHQVQQAMEAQLALQAQQWQPPPQAQQAVQQGAARTGATVDLARALGVKPVNRHEPDDHTKAMHAAPEPAAVDSSQPAGSVVVSRPPAGADAAPEPTAPAAAAAVPGLALPAASAAPAVAQGAAGPAAAVKLDAFAAAAMPTAVKRGDRVAYRGKVHPSLAAAQERLDQLQQAINRVEASSSSRAREFLPQLLMRRTLLGTHGQRPQRFQPVRSPPIGSKGRVLQVTGDKIQVLFDEPFDGGMTISGHRERCGFFCPPTDLQVVEDKDDPLVSSMQALFDVVVENAGQGPLIVYIQNLDRMLRTHAMDHFRKLEALLALLPPHCLVFGGYCSRSLTRPEAKGREGGPPGLSRLFGSLGDPLGGFAEEGGSLLDRFGRGSMSRQRSKSTKGKLLSKMLPNHLELHPPNKDSQTKAWKKMVEGDVAAMRQRSNRTALKKALAKCSMACDDWDAVSITDCQLSKKEIEQLVGMAVAEQLAADGPTHGAAAAGAAAAADAATAAAAAADAGSPPAAERSASRDAVLQQQDRPAAEAASTIEAQSAREASATVDDQPAAMQTDVDEAPAAGGSDPAGGTVAQPAAEGADNTAAAAAGEAAKVQPPWTLRAEHLMVAAEALRKLQAEAAAQPEKQALRDVAVDQYEKQLLSEVIPPEEINVSFDDIGALETVKNTLHEVVILPLQRPELFMRGALTKPTKGLLLFGPPGTGKTMLAKAVACESGAHFINVNMSAITSKWFGEGERLVRALFGLAHKLSPSVIFVDEIDSFLSKRGQSSNEHEALRKMKNEFMTHWDGLRTKASDRVLVLAATNRPMDLDDAVIRRMPRRIFVPLPDVAQREKILQVILKDEDLDSAFDFREAAELSDGYSGSDLKNLCIAAAYCPIREHLDAERAATAAAKAAAATGGAPGGPTASGSVGDSAAAAAAAAAVAASSATPAALANVAAHVALQPVRLRGINMADFKAALKQVTASTHGDNATMSELKRWNDQYGEGGSRQKEHFLYYT